jgi:alanyl-tRNA synthetase
LVQKGLKAVDWAAIVSDKIGGKKGGNEGSAQGAGSNVDQVDEALRLATDFARKLLL